VWKKHLITSLQIAYFTEFSVLILNINSLNHDRGMQFKQTQMIKAEDALVKLSVRNKLTVIRIVHYALGHNMQLSICKNCITSKQQQCWAHKKLEFTDMGDKNITTVPLQNHTHINLSVSAVNVDVPVQTIKIMLQKWASAEAVSKYSNETVHSHFIIITIYYVSGTLGTYKYMLRHNACQIIKIKHHLSGRHLTHSPVPHTDVTTYLSSIHRLLTSRLARLDGFRTRNFFNKFSQSVDM